MEFRCVAALSTHFCVRPSVVGEPGMEREPEGQSGGCRSPRTLTINLPVDITICQNKRVEYVLFNSSLVLICSFYIFRYLVCRPIFFYLALGSTNTRSGPTHLTIIC